MGLRIGIVTIQGAVDKHRRALERLGAEVSPVLRKEDLERLDGLVLPGGESTTISMGLERHGLFEPIQAFAAGGGRVLGTCAGAILLARESRNHPVRTLGLLDAVAERNAYGTQLDSFIAPADEGAESGFAGLECVFIRAPALGELGAGIEVLVRVDGRPVLVRQEQIWASTFHPELTDDLRVHSAWLGL